MRCLVSVFVANFVLVVSCATTAADTTTVFLVRHAEKQSDDSDPSLNAGGRIRSQQLAQVLRSAKLHVCIASQFQRTQQTAKPSAALATVKLLVRSAGREQTLAEEIRKDFNGKNVLFVGHSNTVPSLLKHLGVKDVPAIGESDYDNLFVVQISDTGQTSVLRLHYGSSSSKTSDVKSTDD